MKSSTKLMLDKLTQSQIDLNVDPVVNHKPFITISREFGCGVADFSHSLAEELSQYNNEDEKPQSWKVIDNEILADAAEEMGVPLDIVKHVSYHKFNKSIFESFFSFNFSPGANLNEAKVRNTIAQMINKFALKGHTIIVGRGGVALTRDMEKSLHIRLQAPTDWRIQQVMQRDNLSKKEAEELLLKIDQERVNLRNYFEGKRSDKSIFDLIFNSQTMSQQEMIDMVIGVMLSRGWIKEKEEWFQ